MLTSGIPTTTPVARWPQPTSEGEMVFAPEPGRTPWTIPARYTTGRGICGGFCPCARCENARRRIDGSI